MATLWSRRCFLCLLVLTVASVHGQEYSSRSSPSRTSAPTADPGRGAANATEHTNASLGQETSGTTLAHKGETTPGTTSRTPTVSLVDDDATVGGATVTLATAWTTSQPAAGYATLGYALMVVIILVIMALCVILLCLRRASRTYSFDLHGPEPIRSQFSEPEGNFEPIYLDDLVSPKEQVTTAGDLSPSTAPNGTGAQTAPTPDPTSSERIPDGPGGAARGENHDNNPREVPADADATHDPPPASDNAPFCSPAACPGGAFVDIELDETAWSEQLLAAT